MTEYEYAEKFEEIMGDIDEFIEDIEEEMEKLNPKKIPKKIKLRKGKSVYGERMWYTDYNCWPEKTRLGYRRIKYLKDLFINVEDVEYEMNEFFVDIFEARYNFGKDWLDDLKWLCIYLIYQMEKIEDVKFEIVIRIGDIHLDDKDYPDSAIWLYFFENRGGEYAQKRLENNSDDLNIHVNIS